MKYKVSDKQYEVLVKGIRRYFSEATNSIWDKRNKIKIISFSSEEITIKSFKIPHFINKIAYTFLRDSKAQRSYENSLRIKAFVPKSIGYAEFKKFGLIHDSYFLCEKYAYDFTIRELLTQKDFKDKENIFDQFAAFTYALHQEGVEHLDYSPGNILIKKMSEGHYEFKIIDVNRMRFKRLTQEECLGNFSKLWAKAEDLEIIIKAYAKHAKIDTKKALQIAAEASQKHKDKKNFKKKMLKNIKKRTIPQHELEKKRDLLSDISVVIMVKNAEETIAECLDALRLFDEVVIYLNNSEDATKQIAQRYTNVKLVEGEFLGFGRTKNEAATYSKHAWILSLDSDEILNTNIIDEMMQLDYSNKQKIYRLKRNNYFLGHETQNSDFIVRMYHKEYTQFDDSAVHEKIIVPKEAQLITLRTSFKHLHILNINQTLKKIIHYTDLGSEDKKICFFSVVIAKSIFAFFKTYILQGNILKGWVGYALAVNSANKRHYKYLKQYIHCQEEKRER